MDQERNRVKKGRERGKEREMCFDDDESGPPPTRPLQTMRRKKRDGREERKRAKVGLRAISNRQKREHALLQKMSVRVFCLLPLKAGTVSTVLGEVR